MEFAAKSSHNVRYLTRPWVFANLATKDIPYSTVHVDWIKIQQTSDAYPMIKTRAAMPVQSDITSTLKESVLQFRTIVTHGTDKPEDACPAMEDMS